MDGNPWFKKPIIHKVQSHVRDKDLGMCWPKVISIGAFYYGDASFCKMETLKRKFTYNLSKMNHYSFINSMITSMRAHEEEVRAWYSEELEINSDEFVEIMLFDNYFLIELLLIYFQEGWVFLWREMFCLCDTTLDVVCNDCLMIENHIPFFLLEELSICS